MPLPEPMRVTLILMMRMRRSELVRFRGIPFDLLREVKP